MTLQRFREILDAYGAAVERWPSGERAAALALLGGSPAARQEREQAARLDGLLDRVLAPLPSGDLLDRVVAAATAARAPADDAPAPETHPPASVVARARALRTPASRRARRRWPAIAAVASLAAAAALALWITGGERTSPTVPTPAELAALGTYRTPTDAWLEDDTLDVVDALPTLGCREGEWGCPELEDSPDRSTIDRRRRIYS